MKRFLALFCAMMMVFLCACGKDAQDGTPTEAPTSVPTQAPTDAPTEPAPTLPPQCSHNYKIKETISSTCIQNGHIQYECDQCGHSYQVEQPLTDHIFSPSTCDQPKTCTVCGLTQGETLKHHYTDGKCDICGCDMPVESPTDCQHDYQLASQTAPTCTTAGSEKYQCTICGHHYFQSIAATGHNFTIVHCELPKKCTNCGSYTGEAPGHHYKNDYCTQCDCRDPRLPNVPPTDHSGANYKVGDLMVDFTLTDSEGDTYNLYQLLQDNDLVIINFWYSYCSWCIKEFPYLDSVNQRYDNIQVLALNPIDSASSIASFKDHFGLTLPLFTDDIHLSQGVYFEGYPTSLFINKKREIVAIEVGAITTQEAWDYYISNLLSP